MDRDLVVAARGGDREAYADLVRTRGDRLFGIAQRILRDVDRTEDAVQEALVIAWRDLPGLRDPDRFDAWLHRLLVRSCITEAKRERRLAANVRILPMDIPAATDEFLSVADRDQLQRGFERLSMDHRVVLALRHLLGMTPDEVAETLDLPRSTVYSRLKAATQAMRAALEADERSVEQASVRQEVLR